MMTFQNKILEMNLKNRKQTIVAEIIERFHTFLGSHQENNSLIALEISRLFDCYILKLTENATFDFKSAGVLLENFRVKKSIDIEILFLFLDESRSIVETWIWKQPIEEGEKANGIAKLNEMYIELFKAVSLHSNNLKTEELSKKDTEMNKLLVDRTEMLSRLSNSFAHEIRNPLTSIKGFIQLLENRIDKPTNERMYFRFINQEIKELEEQVNQILYLSNEKNHQDYKLQRISLNGLIINALMTFKPLLNENSIRVDVRLVNIIVIDGIADQLKLAFYKLIQNAVDALLIKSSDRRLKVDLYKEDNKILLSISNNGPPISTQIKKNIFDPFVGTKELGKGIGLAITKQIVEKHNGTVNCWSEGAMTTFEIVFQQPEFDNNEDLWND